MCNRLRVHCVGTVLIQKDPEMGLTGVNSLSTIGSVFDGIILQHKRKETEVTSLFSPSFTNLTIINSSFTPGGTSPLLIIGYGWEIARYSIA